MCGIIGIFIKKAYKNQDNFALALYNIYAQQSSRGTNGYGLAYSTPTEKKLIRLRRTNCTKMFALWNRDHFKKMNKKGTFILFHNRTPTGTKNEPMFNHPFFNEKHDVALIHNGMVFNSDNLKIELDKRKHVFESYRKPEADSRCSFQREDFTDSEVMIHLYEEKKTIKQKIQHIESTCRGRLAIMLIDTELDRMILYKRDNPIIKSTNPNLMVFSSEYHEETLKEVCKLNQKKEFESNECISINRKGKTITTHIKSDEPAYTSTTTTTITTTPKKPKQNTFFNSLISIAKKEDTLNKAITKLDYIIKHKTANKSKTLKRRKEIHKIKLKLKKLQNERKVIVEEKTKEKNEGLQTAIQIVTPEGTPLRPTTVKGAWGKGTCGACGEEKTWIKYDALNKQYLCEECLIDIMAYAYESQECVICHQYFTETFLDEKTGEYYCDECTRLKELQNKYGKKKQREKEKEEDKLLSNYL